MKHQVDIPGFCYDHCGRCGQWIIRDGEIQRLEELIATALARNRGKEVAALSELIANEKRIRNQPCLPKNQKVPP